MMHTKPVILWHPTPDDPFDDVMPEAAEAPPRGYETVEEDADVVDRYEAQQFILSIFQFYDTAWPVEREPLAA